MKALIFNNKVVQLEESEFPVAQELTWMEAPNECEVRWILEDGVLVAPPADPEPTYAENRLLEYPPMQDYLDGIVKDDQAQIDKYISDCKAVKTKWPKDNSGPVE